MVLDVLRETLGEWLSCIEDSIKLLDEKPFSPFYNCSDKIGAVLPAVPLLEALSGLE